MFLSDTKEKKEGQVVIKEVRKDTLKLMLEWMYGAELFPDELMTHHQRLDLYQVADLYLLDPLKEFLTFKIGHSTKPETAFDVYTLGTFYGELRFIFKAVEVMKR
jgi:hypothetical protein